MRLVIGKQTSLGRTLAIGSVLLVMTSVCHAFHGSTMHAWHRTWYGQDPLSTPLRPYFVPRLPGRCDRSAADCHQCGNGAAGYGPTMYAVPAAPVVMPVQSERLGQIPNDMGVGGAVPVSTSGR